MKRILLIAFLLVSRLYTNAQDCCLQAYTSVTNTPFKCLSDVNTKINGHPISEFSPGGSSSVKITNSNGQLQVINFSETPKTYGSEVYGFNGKMVRVYTRNIIVTVPPGFISPQTYVVDDGCNVVCSWAVSQPICVTFPCPPMNGNSCNNPSFFTTAAKLDYIPPVGNFVCMANTQDSVTIPESPMLGQSLKISKNDLSAGGNTSLPTSGGVIVSPEPDHHIISGAPKPARTYGGGVYVYNGRRVKVYTHTKIQPFVTGGGLMRLVVVLDENCNYVGHWQWNQVMCPVAPCYPFFSSSSSIASFFSTAALEGGQ
jgi:hypothetical protein